MKYTIKNLNVPEFLEEAEGDLRISLEKNSYLTVLDGTWEDGVWEYGTWEDGIWKSGTWGYGIWKNGTWKSGTWKNGTWEYGTWENGTWEDGTWEDGTWENGTWESGWILDKHEKGNPDFVLKRDGSFVRTEVSPKEYFNS